MKHVLSLFVGILLLAACGQSYEETKRLTRQQRREAFRADSAALKIAVMPTLDCLPLFVARHEHLLDTLHGGVRLKYFTAQMDCDTAMLHGRVEGLMTDLVRAKCMERQGMALRYVAATNAYWQLIANRSARIHQLRQLDDKMVAMTRYSATDLLTDLATDSARLLPERVFKVQVNDVFVRLQMLRNNELDALWMTEPQATAARTQKHNVVVDTRDLGLRLGVMAFNDREMQRPERATQLKLLVEAYNKACDLLNRRGVRHYRDLLLKHYRAKQATVDSLPAKLTFVHAAEPRQSDVDVAAKWLERSIKQKVTK